MKAFSSRLANFLILTLLSSLTLSEVIKDKRSEVNKIDIDENENKGIESSNETGQDEDRENLDKDGRGLLKSKISGNFIIDKLLNFIRIALKAVGMNQIKVDNIKVPFLSTPIVISGYFSGVDTIQRDGDFNLELGLIKKTKFKAGFKIGRLNGFLSVKVNGTDKKANMSITNVSIKSEFEVQLIKIPPEIKMTEFNLSTGDLKGDFENLGLGLGLLDAGGKLGVKTIDEIKDPILQAISIGVKTLVNSAIKGVLSLPTLVG